MDSETSFAETLARYVKPRGYSIGQLARLAGIPKQTLANWLEGIVRKPRDWRDLVKLAAALHLDEAEATQLLHAAHHPSIDQLLAQVELGPDRHLLDPWAETVQRRLAQSPFQVVADLPYFVGREHEFASLKQVLLGDPPGQLCSLHGMAGTGKTTLAVHLAYELRPYFPDGVLWARLDRADPLSVLNSFAQAYGLDVRDYQDVESRSRVLRELLARKRALIILDNVESSEQVQPLLPPSGLCAVILTSRRHDLAVARGAHRFQIGPFERAEDSFALFAGLLGQEQAHRERETLMAIADLLGHLPLALDIAASRLAHEPGWSAGEFLARLSREERRLGELVYENQSVQLSFHVSYQMLSTEQQQVFHALGLFGGEDFGVAAAAYVLDMEQEAAADQLRSLYALSLVQLGRAGRYRLHPLLRDLALAGKAPDDALERMVLFFVQYAQAHREDYDALDLEIANILAALEAASSQSMDVGLIQGTAALYDYLEARGLYTQAKQHLEQAARAAASLQDIRTQADLTCKLGMALIHCGQLAAAEQRLQEGLRLTRQVESPESIASLLLGGLGLVAYFRSDYEQMERHMQEAMRLARTAHQDEIICQLLDGLNGIAQRRGDYVTAEAYCREGLSLARRLENPALISALLQSLARATFERGGDYTKVSAYLQESLAVTQEMGHRRFICLSLLSLGYMTCEHGDHEQAEAYLHQALGLAHEINVPVERTLILCTLGLTARGRGMYEQSADYLREGLALARQVGITWLIPQIQNAWGWLHLKQQEWEAAGGAFSEALELARQIGARDHIAQALYGLAHVAFACGDLDSARQRGEESLAILQEIGHRTQTDVQAWLSDLISPA